MIELAEILRLHGQSFRQSHPGLSPFQDEVLRDIEYCRTAYFGGHVEQCDCCGYERYSYHSCGDRHCPKCHGPQTERWLAEQRQRLLPCPYYLLTFTLPRELRALSMAHRRKIYGLLMSIAASALQKLARDPQWVGGQLGMLAVLHTWTRALLYHPHVHLLVPAGGFTKEGKWVDARHANFLVPCFALSQIFRAKFKSALKKLGWLAQISPICWQKKWVVHCQHAGSGQKVLDYLGRYVFRIALTNSRLEQFQNGQVTFRYRDNRTQQLKRVTLPAHQFIDRFTQHILPKGFVKVRCYGLWSGHCKEQRQKIKEQLALSPLAHPPLERPLPPPVLVFSLPQGPLCPNCKNGHMVVIAQILPHRNRPP